MTSFEELHADRLPGKLEMCDRILFKGHLTRLYWLSGFLGLLCSAVPVVRGLPREPRSGLRSLSRGASACAR